MKKVPVEKAVGMALAHDITKILPGRFKGVAFKRGHVIREEDIPELLRIGKEYIYVLKLKPNEVHEDDAGTRIAKALIGDGLNLSQPSEGKVSLIAQMNGLLKVNVRGLARINAQRDVIVSTLHTNTPCTRGQVVAATRIIPLFVHRRILERIERICEECGPILKLLPYNKPKVGAVVTGTEIYKGLVRDAFQPYVGKKLEAYGLKVIKKYVVQDHIGLVADAIRKLKGMDCELILVTGGLSVDPDDVTRKAVRVAGARILVYGTPVLPGAMFLLAELDEVPIMGLPACVFYHRGTIFDLILPRILAGEMPTRREINEMGHGGLCMNCPTCHFPICPFGRGGC